MIEEKYKKLINLYIDNEISKKELTELNVYINRSVEGNKYFNEITKITSYLNSSDKLIPNSNVKKNILNAIDDSKYFQTEKISLLKKLSMTIAKLDRKIILSFSSGIALVIIFFTLFGIIDLKNENVDQISGSLTPFNSEDLSNSVEYILDEEFLNGRIQKDFIDEKVNIDLELNSIGENQIAINFDQKYFQFGEIISKGAQSLKFDLMDQTLFLNILGQSNFLITFYKKVEIADPNSITITLNEKKL